MMNLNKICLYFKNYKLVNQYIYENVNYLTNSKCQNNVSDMVKAFVSTVQGKHEQT